MNTYRLYINEDGTVTRGGLFTPKGAKVVARTAEQITIKIPGHSFWRGLPPTPRGYAGVEYVVLDVIEQGEHSVRVDVVKRYTVAEYKAAQKVSA